MHRKQFNIIYIMSKMEKERIAIKKKAIRLKDQIKELEHKLINPNYADFENFYKLEVVKQIVKNIIEDYE